jgi:hypothetical protein
MNFIVKTVIVLCLVSMHNDYFPPMISFEPSMIVSNSSLVTLPIFSPKRRVEREGHN